MGLVGDVAGAFGISKTGMLAGALKMVGVPDKAAHAIGLAAELSRGLSKDGFDLDKTNKGALSRHGMQAFGVDSPMATLGLTAALNVVPKGFTNGAAEGVGGLAGIGGAAGAGGLATGAVGATAAGGLMKSMMGISGLVAGLGTSPNDLASKAVGFIGGDNSQQLRSATGLQRANGGPGSVYQALPKPAFFEDIVAAMMVDFVKDKQKEVEEKLKNLQSRSESGKGAGNQAGGVVRGLANRFVPGAKNADSAGKSGTSESRNIEFELIKNEIQKLQQMQQAMSNVLNVLHETAKSAIANIRG